MGSADAGRASDGREAIRPCRRTAIRSPSQSESESIGTSDAEASARSKAWEGAAREGQRGREALHGLDPA